MGEEEQELKEWAEENFKAVKNSLKKVREEMRNSKPRENISVRRVDSEELENHDDDQIIVEHKVERWFSINYFKKMIQESDSETSEQEEDVIFGD